MRSLLLRGAVLLLVTAVTSVRADAQAQPYKIDVAFVGAETGGDCQIYTGVFARITQTQSGEISGDLSYHLPLPDGRGFWGQGEIPRAAFAVGGAARRARLRVDTRALPGFNAYTCTGPTPPPGPSCVPDAGIGVIEAEWIGNDERYDALAGTETYKSFCEPPYCAFPEHWTTTSAFRSFESTADATLVAGDVPILSTTGWVWARHLSDRARRWEEAASTLRLTQLQPLVFGAKRLASHDFGIERMDAAIFSSDPTNPCSQLYTYCVVEVRQTRTRAGDFGAEPSYTLQRVDGQVLQGMGAIPRASFFVDGVNARARLVVDTRTIPGFTPYTCVDPAFPDPSCVLDSGVGMIALEWTPNQAPSLDYSSSSTQASQMACCGRFRVAVRSFQGYAFVTGQFDGDPVQVPVIGAVWGQDSMFQEHVQEDAVEP